MAIRVMLVDDSAVIRGLLARELTASPDIAIVAAAINGTMAISMAKQHQPDIIILDIEMPEMDGIAALPKLLEASPKSKILMASTLTVHNAAISLKALELGAADYIAKPSARTPQEMDSFYRDLREKIQALAPEEPASPLPVPRPASIHTPLSPIQALAIASSTGGPQALVKLFTDLRGKLPHLPIFLTQHMPPMFTRVLAESLAKAGNRPCTEVKGGEKALPGEAYLAPGDYHMLAMREGSDVVLRINQNPPVNFCRPAADPMFKSLSAIYGKHLMAVVLTGMGQDGMEGAKSIVAAGGSVIAQDEASSVVWSMPKAVIMTGLSRAVLPIQQMGAYLTKEIGG